MGWVRGKGMAVANQSTFAPLWQATPISKALRALLNSTCYLPLLNVQSA